MYAPRMVGIRVGQMLAVKNSDPLLHNVHGLSSGPNSFNVAEPVAGMVQQFKMKAEEMLHLKCDVHSVDDRVRRRGEASLLRRHRYDGTYQDRNVPAGTYKIQAWQERYGPDRQDSTGTGGRRPRPWISSIPALKSHWLEP